MKNIQFLPQVHTFNVLLNKTQSQSAFICSVTLFCDDTRSKKDFPKILSLVFMPEVLLHCFLFLGFPEIPYPDSVELD